MRKINIKWSGKTSDRRPIWIGRIQDRPRKRTNRRQSGTPRSDRERQRSRRKRRMIRRAHIPAIPPTQNPISPSMSPLFLELANVHGPADGERHGTYRWAKRDQDWRNCFVHRLGLYWHFLTLSQLQPLEILIVIAKITNAIKKPMLLKNFISDWSRKFRRPGNYKLTY